MKKKNKEYDIDRCDCFIRKMNPQDFEEFKKMRSKIKF